MSTDKTSKPKQKKIAIIGSGVAGLTTAHYLVADHDVTLFEANDYIGGHVNTLDVSITDQQITETASIDTGFIVFNERTYPNFFRLLDGLAVPFQVTDMSFSVKNPRQNFEYNGHTLNTLLAQRRNIIKPKFWRFVKDIVSFNKHIKQLYSDYHQLQDQILNLEIQFSQLQKSQNSKKWFKKQPLKKCNKKLITHRKRLQQLSDQTLADYLATHSYGKLFTNNYLIPMVSAIWSMGLEDAKGFPLIFFAQFFENHGLLDIVNRPQWFTIKGGSKQYVNKLVAVYADQGGKAYVNSPVQKVTRLPSEVVVEYTQAGESHRQVFDEVVFACHADTALKLLQDPTQQEKQVLSTFRFTDNVASLHTDIEALPKKHRAWASWNYLLPKKLADNTAQIKPVLTYHMNILQRLVKNHNYLVSLNQSVNPAKLLKNIDYRHPVYDTDMVEAQQQWQTISAHNRTHFCGAYWFNGFHEDGVKSGLRVCQHFIDDLQILTQVDPRHLHNQYTNPLFNYERIPYKSSPKTGQAQSDSRIIKISTNTDLNQLFDETIF